MVTRVLICDDAPDVRFLVRRILSGIDDLDVVGEAPDGQAALDQLASTAPDIVVLDIDMPRRDGAHTLPAIRGLRPQTHVLMYSSDRSRAREMRALGAHDFIDKASGHDGLKRAVVDAIAARAQNRFARSPAGEDGPIAA